MQKIRKQSRLLYGFLSVALAIVFCMGCVYSWAHAEDPAVFSNFESLTKLQWSLWDGAETLINIPGSSLGNNVHTPGFATQNKAENMPSQVIVAVVDGFVDYENPDLKDVIYHFSTEEQAALGCGEWGYNATSKAGQGMESFFKDDHGTHCAGIIGAAWDGKGISGVASNVKIISIQSGHPDEEYKHYISYASIIRAFRFVDQFNRYHTRPEEQIRVISISIGFPFASRSLDAAIRDLGEKYGVITVIASGNESKSNDLSLEAASTLRYNPYAIVVDSTDMTGNPANYTNRGALTTTLAAPGSGILSTVPVHNAGYIPDASALADLSAAGTYQPAERKNIFYEGFDSVTSSETSVNALYEKGQVNCRITQIKYDGNNIVKGPETAARITSGNAPRAAGTHGVIVALDPSFNSFDEMKLLNRNTFLFEIRLTEAQVKAMKASQDAGIEPQLGFAYTARAAAVKIGEEFTSPAGVDGATALLARENLTEASEGSWALASTACGRRDDSEGSNSPDDGNDGAVGRLVTIRYLSGLEEGSADSGSIGSDTDKSGLTGFVDSNRVFSIIVDVYHDKDITLKEICFDSIGIGTNEAPYAFMSGTSMATPLVAGSVAVLIARHPEDSATAAAARVRKAVATSEGLKGTSSTSGRLDLALDRAALWTEPGTVQPTWQLYDKTLPLDNSTGDPYVFSDAQGDDETFGPLIALDGKLCFLPAYISAVKDGVSGPLENRVGLNSGSEAMLYQHLFIFDTATETWAPAPIAVPGGPLGNVSACAWNGKLWIFGMTTRKDDLGWSRFDPDGAVRILSWDPGTDSWETHAVTGIADPDLMTLFADEGGLKLFDGGVETTEQEIKTTRNARILSYSPTAGAGDVVASFDRILDWPIIATHGSTIYVRAADEDELYEVKNGKVTELSVKLPKQMPSAVNSIRTTRNEAYQLTPMYAALIPGETGLWTVGYTDQENRADTWFLPYGGSDFQPYEKRITVTESFLTSAAMMDDTIYAISTAWGEKESRAFRATATVCSVTFDPAGGVWSDSSKPAVIRCAPGTTVTTPPAPTRPGFSFAGWRGDDGAFYPAGGPCRIHVDTMFTAQWVPNTGDSHEPLLWLMMTLAGGIGWLLLHRRGKPDGR